MTNTALEPLDLDLDLSELELSVRPTARERLIWRAQRLGSWGRAHALDLIILAVLTTVAVIAHMHGMYNTPERFDDEGTYTAYAWAVQHEGSLAHYTYWYAHPPLGQLQMALWNWLTGASDHAPYAIAGQRQFMVVTKIVSVILLYVLALRLRMTRVAAAGAVLIFALSPLAVYFTRTALLDNLVTPWLLAAFVLAASPRRGLRTAVGSAACFAVAILTKETVLLFLPALALLFWQCSDRRNRKFGVTLFVATLGLLVVLYPAYAMIKNELFMGKGHVSLLWAIKWQLFDRQGSGSVLSPHSTAHAVVTSWVIQDPWLTRISLICIVPALLVRRTRAIGIAFGIQAAELLRSGYLPYPFVVAMLPFAALTIVGVLDVIWQGARVPLPARIARTRFGAWLVADRPRERDALVPRIGRLRLRLRRWAAGRRQGLLRRMWSVTWRGVLRVSVVAAVVALLLTMQTGWQARMHELWYRNRDAGAAAALAWVRGNVPTSQRVVVDDAFWVDLVTHGFKKNRTIWYTKLDVDPDVKLPARPAWSAIDYVMLTFQDEMSLHMTLDDTATPSTRTQFPTLGAALSHSQIVARFGKGQDRVVVWRVVPNAASGPGP